MSALISITAPETPEDQLQHRIQELPVLVVFPHNQCNCRCMMCDIWRIREAKQISPEDLGSHIGAVRNLKVRWVVFSGGEPQLNEKWATLAQMFRSTGSRITLLTAGLLLKAQAQQVVECVDDVIVSLDGPPAVHNAIRRVAGAFEQLAEGVAALRDLRPEIQVGARCTVQKANHQSLRAVVASATEIGLSSISFLAADLTSSAFNRIEEWPSNHRERIALTAAEVEELSSEVECLISDNTAQPGFVAESPEKLRRIVHHFRASLGQSEPVAPRCNAPWVSAVLEASGDIRPCFFHPVLGNIRDQSLEAILNGPGALQFRSNLDVEHNETCRRCVCSLHLTRPAA